MAILQDYLGSKLVHTLRYFLLVKEKIGAANVSHLVTDRIMLNIALVLLCIAHY